MLFSNNNKKGEQATQIVNIFMFPFVVKILPANPKKIAHFFVELKK